MRSYPRNTVGLHKIQNPFNTQPESFWVFFFRIVLNAKYHIESVLEIEIFYSKGRKTEVLEKLKTHKGSILNLHCKLNYANQNYP